MNTTAVLRRRRLVLVFLLVGVIEAMIAPAALAAAATSASAGGEIAQWRAAREASLRSETGWLTLVGLFWLRAGENRFGSAKDGVVVLDAPGVPADAGSFLLDGDKVRVTSRAGAALTLDGVPVGDRELRTDAGGKPDVLRLGRLSFYVIRRGERFGVRVKDPEAATRVQFRGLEHFAADPAWRVEARFVPFPKPVEITVPTAIGDVEKSQAKGRLEFTRKGRALSLVPFVDDESGSLFIVFRDATSGATTYGAGRFLDADAPRDGKVILDFNRAYNPPCAFTPFATCPLPPRENRLPLAVEAGEKKYGDH